MFAEFDNCKLCPRECGVDRNSGQIGYCGFDSGYHIASVFMHQGEEPPINGLKGICNVFFRGCNMRCTYCQNYQISRKYPGKKGDTCDNILLKIIECLNSGAEAVGFVSPSHFIPHVKQIISILNGMNYNPITVFNTNAYDKPGILKELEGTIDVYLPDFKYLDKYAALKYSGSIDYPNFAKSAIKEMYRQKGSTVIMNENGQAVTGLIIRHLVLPGHSKDSIKILEWIASELSPSVHISLMSQYYPTPGVSDDPILGRSVTSEEYNEVIESMNRLGFYRGWIQDIQSHSTYRPDFHKQKPFRE